MNEEERGWGRRRILPEKRRALMEGVLRELGWKPMCRIGLPHGYEVLHWSDLIIPAALGPREADRG